MFEKTMEIVVDIKEIKSLFYFEFSKDYRNFGESHDFWEIVYVDKGEIEATAGEKTVNVKWGQAIFHKPNEFHNIIANKTVAPNIFITSFVCNSPAMKFFENKVMEISPKQREIIRALIDDSKETHLISDFLPYKKNKNKPHTDVPIGGIQMIKLYIEQLLISLLRSGKEVENSGILFADEAVTGERVKDIIRYMSNALFGKFSVENMCAHFGYSKAYLSRIFKEETGRTLLEYYTDMKISEARRLIREKKYNFAQISDLLCFDNPRYFSRVFKRVTGLTPQEYKKSVLGE